MKLSLDSKGSLDLPVLHGGNLRCLTSLRKTTIPPRIRLAAFLILPAVLLAARPGFAADPEGGNTPSDTGLVFRALAAELRAAQDTTHPMRYLLRKSTPRLTSTKEIVETADGNVAMLFAVNDSPPTEADREKDHLRLDALLADPSRQRKRKQTEQEDTARALKVLRALPTAFLYQYKESGKAGTVPVEKFTLRPNPKFDPPDLETQVLTGLTGEIWIDPVQERVVHLEGHLQEDVDFGWGILARLNKGGWVIIEQADVGGGNWRTVRLQMVMSGRVFIKTRSFDTTEVQSAFTPVPRGMTYQQGIQMLRSEPANSGAGR